jgi:NADP-dependent 3-hydroxy acid dehydrogenase YdfG
MADNARSDQLQDFCTMRVLHLGSTGVLGKAVNAALAGRHETIGASRHGPAFCADLEDEASLEAMLAAAAPLDAVVCTAGEAAFGPLGALTEASLISGMRAKLFGQIALARLAFGRLREAGSVTLTAGVLNHRPIPGTACGAAVNGALEGFVRAAALETPRGIRINLVSPGVLEESWSAYGKYFAGFVPVPASRAAQAYVDAAEGVSTGQVFSVN